MYIKKPGARHKGFRLCEIIDGKHITQHFPELDAINHDYIADRLTYERARKLVEELRASKQKPKPVSWLTENMNILEQYWDEVGKNKEIKEPRASLNRFKWAVKHLGATSLITASVSELREALKHLRPARRKSASSALNTLIRFKGMDKVLASPRVEWQEPVFLTIDEFTEILRNIPRKEWKLCCQAAIGTGSRYGELFEFQKGNLKMKGSHMWIAKQRLRNWEQRSTKNGKMGHAYIVDEFRDAVHQWIEVPAKEKKKMRQAGEPGEIFSAIAKTVTGKDSATFHNLRHSYARIMTERGASLDDLRRWMRDRMSTIELYYSGWIQSDTEMEANLKRFG